MRLKALLVVTLMPFLLLPTAAATRSDDPSYLKRSSSAIAITADGDTLLVVNPDSNSLTLGVFEAGQGRKIDPEV